MWNICRQVWWEDAVSLRVKAALSEQFGLGGVAVWTADALWNAPPVAIPLLWSALSEGGGGQLNGNALLSPARGRDQQTTTSPGRQQTTTSLGCNCGMQQQGHGMQV